MTFYAQFLSPCLSTVPWARWLLFMINYHFGMRMMVFYSPQVIFYQIPIPSFSLGRPHCHGDPITPPQGSSDLCGIRLKLHGVLADSKPYGCQVWKFIRTIINNKLLLSLQILGKKDIADLVAEGESVPSASSMKWLDWNCHISTVLQCHMWSTCIHIVPNCCNSFWSTSPLIYGSLNHFCGIWILNI